jgi:DNA-directed RNA polymerase subunit RPC12/RpoP
MAVIEATWGHCSQCGHGLLVQVWWPATTLLERFVATGMLSGLDDDDLAELLEAAQQVDELERDENGDLSPVYRAAGLAVGASVFVDGSKEQAIKCPQCGGLLGILAKERVG